MPNAAPNPARVVSALGNGGAGQKVTCAGGSMAVLDEDLATFLARALIEVSVADAEIASTLSIPDCCNEGKTARLGVY